MAYSRRLTKPLHNNTKYYSNDNFYQASGVGIYHKKDGKMGYYGNCTAYAWGRMWEINKVKPSLSWCGDPKGMYNSANKGGFKTGKEPKLGAMIVFQNGTLSHIACVEKIAANGDLTLSQSAWNRVEFELVTVTKASNYTYAGSWSFVGFIYPNIDYGTDKLKVTKEEEKSATATTGVFKAGAKMTLKNVKGYTSETTSVSYATKTGVFYAWDNNIINGRIKITNKSSDVGVKGGVICWIDFNTSGLQIAAKITEPKITAGQKFVLKNTPVYTNENGASVGDRTGTFYAWETETTQKRIRMTNDLTRVGKNGQVSFFCAVSDLKKL